MHRSLYVSSTDLCQSCQGLESCGEKPAVSFLSVRFFVLQPAVVQGWMFRTQQAMPCSLCAGGRPTELGNTGGRCSRRVHPTRGTRGGYSRTASEVDKLGRSPTREPDNPAFMADWAVKWIAPDPYLPRCPGVPSQAFSQSGNCRSCLSASDRLSDPHHRQKCIRQTGHNLLGYITAVLSRKGL